LQRSGANFFGIDRRIEVEQGFDISAHRHDLNGPELLGSVKASV
jgi:hypothetical protein